jgi:catechol 2,3-dioxygenase-like lactoylglutathione lyase family enzyme
MVGINHVALEVGNVDEAVDFYGRTFDLELRGRLPGMAFLDMGDQFLALAESDAADSRSGRHFGLVVDDRTRVRQALEAAGVEIQPSRGLRFRDPWGNLVEVVQYSEVQFTKAPAVLAGMGLEALGKSESAQQELREKGLL